jgi:hypothetical protein
MLSLLKIAARLQREKGIDSSDQLILVHLSFPRGTFRRRFAAILANKEDERCAE